MIALVSVALGKPSSHSSSYGSSSHTSRPSASKLYNRSSSSSSGGYSKPSSLPKANSSSASSGGYSKPPSAPSPAPKTASRESSDGYSKPASSPAPTAFAKGNRFDKEASRTLQMEKSRASQQAYEDNRAKFRPVSGNYVSPRRDTFASNPVYRSTRMYGSRIGYDDVYIRRQRIYSGWSAPLYVYQCQPSYGSWDSMFLWWMIWHDQSSAFAYHHYNDPYYQAWRRDALLQSEQNGELRAALARQDEEIAAMRQQGVAVNAAYLPPALASDPVVALSDDAIGALPVERPLLRVATGVEGGRYYQVGQVLKSQAGRSFDVELVPTSGAAENLRLLRQGKVDAAIVQSDTDFVLKELASEEDSDSDPKMLKATIYTEYAMLVVGKDSSINSVNDLKTGDTIYVGPEGSGTSVTWSGFVREDPRYKEVRVAHEDYRTALELACTERRSAVLFIAGPSAPLLKKAGDSGKYRLVPVDDPDLDRVKDETGQPVYDSLTISADAYPGMQKGELKTLAVDAVWTLSSSWVKKFGDPAFDQVNYAVMGVISELHIASIEAHRSAGHWMLISALGVLAALGIWWFVTKVNITSKR